MITLIIMIIMIIMINMCMIDMCMIIVSIVSSAGPQKTRGGGGGQPDCITYKMIVSMI